MRLTRAKSLLPPEARKEVLGRHASAPIEDGAKISRESTVTPSDNPWRSKQLSAASSLLVQEEAKLIWPKDAKDVTADVGDYVLELVNVLSNSGRDPATLRKVLTFTSLTRLLRQVELVFQNQPNVYPIIPGDDVRLSVLGDTHGQLYDVLHVFQTNGYPSAKNWYLFNGDFVDRGSWGLELAITLFAFKILYPDSMFLSRGNHETLYCTRIYGFMDECKHKYSKTTYLKFNAAFARIPLAAVILPYGSDPTPLLNAGQEDCLKVGSGLGIFVVHGGLYRSVDGSVGTIKMLQNARRHVKDPQMEIILDAMWSDPQVKPGISDNVQRGLAILFGPDVTEEFLQMHGLSLLIRSHEGPDAREKRPYMVNGMMDGFSVDQTYPDTDVPLCISIFSAPDYPMGPMSRGNEAAFLRFDGDSLRTLKPQVVKFKAVPRPQSRIYANENASELTDVEEDAFYHK